MTSKQILSQGLSECPELAEVRKFVETNYGTTTPSFKEFLVDRATRVKKLSLPSWDATGATIGQIEFEAKLTPEQNLMANINIASQKLKGILFGLMSPDKLYFIMFDKLDDAWDDSQDFKSSLVGLLQATRDLNLESRKLGKSLRCTPFLRSDIYDRLNYNDKNKAFYDIEFLHWDSDALKSLVEKRISFYGGVEEKTAWDAIFDTKPLAKNTTNLNYILKRTLMRPRDIIAYCESCKDVADKKKHPVIWAEDVYDAESKFSRYMYKEWIDETHKQHPYIEHLFGVLRKVHCERFAFPEFQKVFDETKVFDQYMDLTAEVALSILVDLSIIGIESIGGASGGSTFLFKYLEPSIELNLKKYFVVHPSLKKELKLVEFRAKKSGN